MTDTPTTTTQNKLGLPRDIAHKIFALLKPQTRPACVLVFGNTIYSTIVFKRNTLTDDERDFIMHLDYKKKWLDHDLQEVYITTCFPTKQVQAALLLGFYFKDEPSRARWQNNEPFELYRDAIHAITTTTSTA
jgi:hypothetical protein